MYLPQRIYDKLIGIIKEHEGLYLEPYLDSMGVKTAGYGSTHINKEQAKALNVNSFDDIESITKEQAENLLEEEVAYILVRLNTIDWVDDLPNYAKLVFLDLCYNVGLHGALSFSNMIKYLKEHNFEKAGLELMDSKLLSQVKGRNIRMGMYLMTGVLIDIDNARKLYDIYKKRL